MKIEEMCVKEGLFFRDFIAEKYYCKLSYSYGKAKCKYIGEKDESLLFVCNYDKIEGNQKGDEK